MRLLGPYQLVHVKFGVSSWRGSRVDGRSYLLSGAIDGSEVNEIIQNLKWELESSCFTFDLVPLVVRSVYMRNEHVKLRYAFWDLTNAPAVFIELDKMSKQRTLVIPKMLCGLGPTSVKRYGRVVHIWLARFRTSIWRDVRAWGYEEGITTIVFYPSGADTMLCGFRLTNRWLSMKKVIASCGSKCLAYLEVEVEYQGSSGLLLQPELPE
ncbi:hypothetical protein Tco_1562742 [Tanacetum coccineum]